MNNIVFIDEDSFRDIAEAEFRSYAHLDHIQNGEGFINHLIATGRIAHDLGVRVLQKHPELKSQVDPEILRVQGYMHDYTKMMEGGPYHEIGTAEYVLTHGESLGLIAGGTSQDRSVVLRGIARVIPPDFALYEELGGLNFPDGAEYPEIIDQFKPRLDYLRAHLSEDDKPLSLEKFALPRTLMQMIALYADLTNMNGNQVPIEQRLADIVERDLTPGRWYNPTRARLVQTITPRVLVAAGTVESLL